MVRSWSAGGTIGGCGARRAELIPGGRTTMATSALEVRPVSTEELERFTRQLGVLLSTGVEMLRALDVAAQQSGSGRLVATARSIAVVMTDGREFHTALARHPDLFSVFYAQMARQGEEDGVLGEALLAVADDLV